MAHWSRVSLVAVLWALGAPPDARACPAPCGDKRLGTIAVLHRRLAFVPPPPRAASDARKLAVPTQAIQIEHGPRYPSRVRERERRLLLLEISNVARLLRVTPRNSKEQPRILRRLADDYAELAASARDEARRSYALAFKVEGKNPVRAAKLRRLAMDAARLAARASDKSIALYQVLVREYPDYCHARRDRGCRDEALHYLASELLQADRADEALAAQRALLRGSPRSPYAPQAHLALAEQSFEDARRDPSRWPDARRHYLAALKRAPAKSALAGYARYKLAHVYWSEGELDRALTHLEKAIEVVGSPKELLDAARRDLVLVYAQAAAPEQAWQSFARLAGDAPGETARSTAMLERLARKLLDFGRHEEALVAYQELMKRKPRCSHRVAIARAMAASDSSDRPAVLAVLDELRQHYRGGGDDSARCTGAAAGVLFEIAATWHSEALGTDTSKGTGNQATLTAAEQLYGWIAEDFGDDAAELERAGALPSLAVLRYRRGDVLHALGRWRACAHAFGDAYDLDPEGELAADALSASGSCWLRAQQSAAELTPDDGVHLLRTFDRAVCLLTADDRIGRSMLTSMARHSSGCATPSTPK
jgi:tetratricopeptide (TPR) repeat protein